MSKLIEPKKRGIKAELRYLSLIELLNAIVFMLTYFFAIFILQIPRHIPSVLYPLSLVSVLLLEGSFYWFNLLRRCEGKSALPTSIIAPLYQCLKIMNSVLILSYFPVLIFSWGAGGIISKSFGFLLLLFAVIEHINYFYVRLSYYSSKNITGLQIIEPIKKLFLGQARRSKIAHEIEIHKKTKRSVAE